MNLVDDHSFPALPVPFRDRHDDKNLPKHELLFGTPLGGTTESRSILSIGDDAILLSTRHMVLESSGFRVHSVSSFVRVQEEKVRQFDLVLICHSVEEDRSAALAAYLKTIHPGLQILRFSRTYGGSANYGRYIAPSRPEELLREVNWIFEGVSLANK